jgi:hypothetical protein
MKKTSTWLSLVVAVGAAACGGGGVKLTDLADEVHDAQCEWAVRCGVLPNTEACAALGTADDEIAQLQASVDAGRLSYDEDKAADCVDAFADASCELFGVSEAAQACEEVFTGLVADGGTCYDDEECVSDNCQQTDPACDMACCAGTCMPGDPEAQIGEDCSEADCVDGAHCAFDSASSTFKCEADIAEGQACTGGGCADGLFCDVTDPQTGAGTCKAPADEGQTCNPQSFFGACARIDNWCNPATSKCEKRKAPGEACDVEIDNCVEYAECQNGTCVGDVAEGAACNEQTGPTASAAWIV